MDINLIQYIKPELLVLIPILWFVGFCIKKSNIKDTFIPLILGGAGIILATVWIFGNVQTDFANCLFAGITQGILCAAASVYGTQIYIQAQKDKKETADKTEEVKEDK